MCGNRVEELESRVKELEASVEGLTDELVECKVRLQELEDAPVTDDGETDTEESTDGIHVPDPAEPTDATDTSNTEAREEEDSTEESDSDIIVA
jgi:hypothetical protein